MESTTLIPTNDKDLYHYGVKCPVCNKKLMTLKKENDPIVQVQLAHQKNKQHTIITKCHTCNVFVCID